MPTKKQHLSGIAQYLLEYIFEICQELTGNIFSTSFPDKLNHLAPIRNTLAFSLSLACFFLPCLGHWLIGKTIFAHSFLKVTRPALRSNPCPCFHCREGLLSSQEFGSFFGRGNHQAVRTQSNCPCLLLRQR